MKKWNKDSAIGDIVLFNNHHHIILNKPPGMPSQRDESGDISIIQLAEAYTKKKLFINNRIDRPASGILVLSKSKEAAEYLNAQLRENQVEKSYIAACANAPEEKEGTLSHHLQKSRSQNKMIASSEKDQGQLSQLRFEVLGKSDRYHFLKINLITGRHHQIRAQLAAVGSPIKGDVKYGDRRKNKDRSIHLHAHTIWFNSYPRGEKVEVVAPFFEDPIWNYFESEYSS
jgi:23S rRNA pseudouridine1911/1915/1917 synthase